LKKYIEELKQEKAECDRWDTEEMIGESWVYEQVISHLESIVNQ